MRVERQLYEEYADLQREEAELEAVITNLEYRLRTVQERKQEISGYLGLMAINNLYNLEEQ